MPNRVVEDCYTKLLSIVASFRALFFGAMGKAAELRSCAAAKHGLAAEKCPLKPNEHWAKAALIFDEIRATFSRYPQVYTEFPQKRGLWRAVLAGFSALSDMHWQESISFRPELGDDVLAVLPDTPAVFLLSGESSEAEPYLNKTARLRSRLERLLSAASADSKRLNLRASTRRIEYTLTGSEFENRLLLYRAMRKYFPQSYRRRMKLVPAALIKIGWENPYPRAYFTRRLPSWLKPRAPRESGPPSKNVYYGPFASKSAAHKFLNDALDLFKSRRCTFNINPDPTFPGCMYSEMKMCLAPCFAGCTREEYLAEVERVQSYLDTRGQSLVRDLEAEREAAAAQLEFERAAAIHARVEKVKAPWNGVPEIVGPLEELRAVVVQKSALADHVALFDFRNGLLYGPIQFGVAKMQHPNPASGSSSLFAHPHLAVPVTLDEAQNSAQEKHKPQTLEARVTEALASIETRPAQRGEAADHLALLRRWYYRPAATRRGEIFITHGRELPLRRIVRGISRVFSGEKEQGAATQTAEAEPS